MIQRSFQQNSPADTSPTMWGMGVSENEVYPQMAHMAMFNEENDNPFKIGVSYFHTNWNLYANIYIYTYTNIFVYT